ncbi:MAG: NAD(P)/FAD-dependent oxidoreductase [Anaerolineae bacterium]|nr:NAD(P)/FAD-dependent oxidoreductase [Anaerolineae bacterium]
MADYDIIVIGAGHNALVCAGYLAQANYRVLVLERRPIAGGAVVTEEIIPGFRFDLGGSAHILIHHTPIVQDLQLTRFGLEYIDLDPLFFAPFPDGSHITIWQDLDKTCDSIAAVSPEDAAAYRHFIDTWTPIAQATVETFLHPPTPVNVVRHLIFGSGLGSGNWERLSDILRGYGQLLRQSFRSPKVQAVIGWMAAQSGPPPTEPLSAPFALWHPMYHVSGMKRPRGGSGMLTQALAKMISAHGGEVKTSMPVSRILVEHGRAVGVETVNGERFTAKTIISGAHIHTTLKLLEDTPLPKMQKNLLAKTRVGNGFGMVVRYAMNELPNYVALPTENGPGPQHTALQFICPDLAYLDRAYGDYLGGRPSEQPALISMTFSAVDPTLAPPGQHTMFLWGQYYPYELASGESWDDIGQREADRMLATLAQYAPNVTNAVIGQLVETPLYLERELGLHRGNVMHLEMSIDQMFMMRPALTMSNYRGPIKGLYLTGASTHPGGGIMGAAGRNAAQVVLHDLSGRRWF